MVECKTRESSSAIWTCRVIESINLNLNLIYDLLAGIICCLWSLIQLICHEEQAGDYDYGQDAGSSIIDMSIRLIGEQQNSRNSI
jgi:uncharacterized membrane protein YhaH (DUF805 family)